VQTFLGGVVDKLASHPGIAAGAIAGIILVALIRAVISSSYRYR
jgi:hypothetical protein